MLISYYSHIQSWLVYYVYNPCFVDITALWKLKISGGVGWLVVFKCHGKNNLA